MTAEDRPPPPTLPKQPVISVIIPYCNRPAALKRCLTALKNQRAGAFVRDIIVVDGGSRSLPVEICHQFQGVTLLLERESGVAAARNRGAAHAHGDVLAFLDAECVPCDGWLAAISNAFRDDPSRAIVGGDLRTARAGKRFSQVAAYEQVFSFRTDRSIANKGFPKSGNLAIRRDVFDAVNAVRRIDGAEDRDWGRRAVAMGHGIAFERDMIVYRRSQSGFDDLAREWDEDIRHEFGGQVSGTWRAGLWAARAIAITLSPLAAGPEVLMTDRLRGPRERSAALLCLNRVSIHRSRRMLALLLRGNRQTLAWR